jgi:hypothetical protein
MSESGKKGLSPDHCEWPTCAGVPGHPTLVQRHRIHPGREKGKYKRGNVISLCPNCHLLADLGIIPREVLQVIVDLRLKNETEQKTIDQIDQQGDPSAEIVGSDSSEESDQSGGDSSPDAGDGEQRELPAPFGEVI